MKTYYLTSDLRPVFPEERLLLALLLNRPAEIFLDCSVWASGNRYYVDGKSISIPESIYTTADNDYIAKKVWKTIVLLALRSY